MTVALVALVALLAAFLAVAAWVAVFLARAARNAELVVRELQHQIHRLEAGDTVEMVEWDTQSADLVQRLADDLVAAAGSTTVDEAVEALRAALSSDLEENTE